VTATDALIAAARDHVRHWRLDAAIAGLDALLAREPASAGAHFLRGEALFLQRRIAEALASHAAAVRYGIDRDPELRASCMSWLIPGDFAWTSHMLLGDFESAWRLADAGRVQRAAAGITGRDWPRHLRPIWDGSDLSGRRVLVRCYHGLGDTIHFIRYVPMLAARAAAVCVEVQPQLLPLVSGLDGIDRVFALPEGQGETAREAYGCEVEIDVTELPHAFRTTLATIPASVPYLAARQNRTAPSAAGSLPERRRLAVGLTWAAGSWKPDRSIPIAMLGPLGEIPGLSLHSLQRGPEHERWRAAQDGPSIAGTLESDEIEETAAVMARLDLVITVDTMVAHLAGALGVPVWLLLHFAADWRWLLDRSDSPWYPTMRLFRQPSPGDWDSVVGDVCRMLRSGAPCRAGGRRY